AGTLGFDDTRAVFFAFDADEARRLRNQWAEAGMSLPLEVEEAEYRDIGDPLLTYLRRITADPDAVAVVIMPELIFSGSQRLLHNQRALYIKRLRLLARGDGDGACCAGRAASRIRVRVRRGCAG